jgi:hypothetical protein
MSGKKIGTITIDVVSGGGYVPIEHKKNKNRHDNKDYDNDDSHHND